MQPALLPGALTAAETFPLQVPRGYARLMEKGNPDDPLLRQVWPLAQELQREPGFHSDPVGDLAAACGEGLLQKYAGRALLIATAACAIHCRYCFRRDFPYADHQALPRHWPALQRRLSGQHELQELILSGGEPLLLEDSKLQELIAGLTRITSLRRLRIHSRLPVVLPSRITKSLCDILTGHRLATVLVVHANHPRELGAEAREALGRLHAAGVTLLNQSVLLRGVNDSVEVLQALSEALFESRVLPYYLHQLDRVRGSGHFAVPDAEARRLIESLRSQLSGYLVPRLVRDGKGQPSKLPLC